MKRMSVLFNLVLVFVLFSVPVQAQTAKPASKPAVKAPARVSANDELIKLAKAGMSEEIILAVVTKTDKSAYNTSADALVALKEAGISDKVISAILGVGLPSPTTPSKSAQAPATPAVSSTQRVGVSLEQTSTRSADGSHEAGIYLIQGSEFVQLEPSVYSGGKTGNKFGNAITTLIPRSEKAVIRSAKASQRLQVTMPVFQFYFENRGAGLSNTGGMFSGFMNGASSPNEFVLVRMKVSTDEREIVIGKSWTFSDRQGVQSKDTVDFSIEKLRTGVYKVTPKSPLTPGEYCFFYAAGTAINAQSGAGKLFDFGVDPGASVQ